MSTQAEIKFMGETTALLQETRKTKGFSQVELGKITNTPQKTISQIENGVVIPNIATLLRITEALDLELNLSPKV